MTPDPICGHRSETGGTWYVCAKTPSHLGGHAMIREDGAAPDAAIADPLERQRVALVYLEDAREEWKRQAKHWSAIRAKAVQELKTSRTWAEVAELLGVSEATAWNVAHPKSG